MPSLKIAIDDSDHVQGGAHPLVTLVEYGDYECPYCGLAYLVVKQLQEQYWDILRFVFRNFPLSEAHPHALSAATTAEYAGACGFFWEVHDALYENQHRLGLPLYNAIIHGLDLPAAQLLSALEHNAYKEKIRSDFNGGVRNGVNGTPSFFFNGQRYNGPVDFNIMVEIIEELILTSHG